MRLLVKGFLLLTLGACSTPGPAPDPIVSNQRVYIPIARIQQEDNLCVPTSAAMVLAYFGDPRSPRELKVYTRGRDYNPKESFNDFTITYYRDMVAGMQKIGYSWSYRAFPSFESGISAIKAHLRTGNPVLVDITRPSQETHTFVINGFDDERKILYVTDPSYATGSRQELSFSALGYEWSKGRPVMFTSRRGISK
jgi:hypothetical protein